MELEIGMYVRTKAGMTAKIVSKEDVSGSLHREEIVFILDNGNKLALHSQKVIKASHNIIDLIEVGDYVNGYKVYYCYCADEDMTGLFIDTEEKKRVWLDYSNQLKSIVTKEQFEAMAYKVV